MTLTDPSPTAGTTPAPAAGATPTTTAKIFGYPLNAWYVAAWDHEVTARGILARRVCDRPLALYRTADGRVAALADACWHRLAPLSKGKLVGDEEIQCPYHGLRYNAAGRCTHMPAQKTINPSATVPSYPAVERYRYVWVWLGDPDLADPDTIPTCTRWPRRTGRATARRSTPAATTS